MDKIVNCADAAFDGIEITLDQLEVVKKALEEKKGYNSRALRIFLTIVYSVGVVACVIWALMYKEISLTPMDANFGYFVIITAGASNALFFAILIVGNLIEAKYYKTIFVGERNVARMNRHLQKVKKECSDYYGLLDTESSTINYSIELGEDISASIESTKTKIEALEKRKSNVINGLISFVYYVAAIAVGAFIILFIQSGFRNALYDMIISFGADSETASSCAEGIYWVCALCAIAGPIFARYYFEGIKLVELKDSLIFLIAGSGIAAFIAAVIAAGLIAGVIALVWLIIQAILAILAAIFAIIVIIAIIAGLLSGG